MNRVKLAGRVALTLALAVAAWLGWTLLSRTPVPDVTVAWPALLERDALFDAEGLPVDPAVLNGKFVGVYFSALNCAPCQTFTPKLVRFRNAHAEQFEVVFISSDINEEEKQTYMQSFSMPWPAFSLRGPATERLADAFGVRAIPFLCVLGPDGRLLAVSGRADVEDDPDGALERWKGLAE